MAAKVPSGRPASRIGRVMMGSLASVPGLSRRYCRERGNGFRAAVTVRDADVILSSECGNEFVPR